MAERFVSLHGLRYSGQYPQYRGEMGFRLWLDSDTAWAEGAHEYRPMGAACVAISAVFATRDFRKSLQCPSREAPSYCGLFASLGQMNAFLRARRSEAVPPIARSLHARFIP